MTLLERTLVPLIGEVAYNDLYYRFDRQRYRLGARWVYQRRGDAMFASFQKSGRTWIRVILAKCLELEYDVPFSTFLHRIAPPGVPRLLFVHYPEALRYHRRKPTILLTRDPRDTLVSYYHHCVSRKRSFDGSIGAFLASHYGLSNIVAYYNRVAHDLDRHPRTLVISYEQTHADPEQTLAAILGFLGIEITAEVRNAAVDFARFENMQRLERGDGLSQERLVRTPNKADPNAFKARRGKVGGYREELSVSEIERMEGYLRSHFSSDAKRLLGFD